MNHASFHYTRSSWQEIYTTYPYSLLFLLSLVLSRHFLFEQLNQDLRFEHDHSRLKEDFLVSYPCKEIEWTIINIIFVTLIGIIIQSKFFFLFISRDPTTWPANNCLQIMACSCAMPSNSVWLQIIFCSCVKETGLFSFLRSLIWKWQTTSLPKDIH